MFNKETEKNPLRSAETIIGPSIKVKGDFHGEGNVIIEGIVEGDLSTKEFLTVGQSAKIIANIKAKNAKISGHIIGNIIIHEFLEISSSAQINGDINTKEISIEKGAKINGNINMTGPELNKPKEL